MDENGFTSIESDSKEEKPVAKEKTTRHKIAQILKDNLLLILLLCALVVGIGVGAGVRNKDPPLNEKEQMYFRYNLKKLKYLVN